jgi:hypothetical protein
VERHADLQLLVLVELHAEDALGEVASRQHERRAGSYLLFALPIGSAKRRYDPARRSASDCISASRDAACSISLVPATPAATAATTSVSNAMRVHSLPLERRP